MPTYFPIRTFKTELQRLRTAIDHLAVGPYGAKTPNSSDSAIAEASLALDSLERRLHFAQEELSQDQERARAASELSWSLRRRLADEAAKVRELDNRLHDIEDSVVWKITKPLWKLLRRRNRRPIQYRNSEFSYAVEWPRFWKTSRTKLLVEGWCFLLNRRELAGVRAHIDGKVYPAQYGIERPDLRREASDFPAARNSGFSVEVPVISGRSILQLEAIAEGDEWYSFAEREIVCASTTAIDDDVPLPPHRLMVAVAGHDDDEEFRRSRISGPKQMLEDLAIASIDVAQIDDVLDFGCGCGRFLAGWLVLQTSMRLYGCDYNPELVRWCNANLPGVSVRENQLGKPLPYPPSSFDLIYLISVMTHLTLREQQQLVSEFRRVVRPGGYVYVTFHGEPFYEQLFARVENGEEQFRRTGFLIGANEKEGTNDCWTLQSPENVIDLFQGFTLIKHFRASERGPTDVGSWQDSMIFKAKAFSNGSATATAGWRNT